MRVNSEMLSVRITTLNRMLGLIGAESKLHIERFNGYTWIKKCRGGDYSSWHTGRSIRTISSCT